MKLIKFNKIPMIDKFGAQHSITLDRLNDDGVHSIDNVVFSCFQCNSSHQNNRQKK